jgi:hypothetical protein
MDGRKFDALARNLGNPTTRRVTLQGLAVGLLGLGVNRHAAAQDDGAVAEGCRVKRCKKKVLTQPCLDRNGQPKNRNCCQGLKCSNKRGDCVWKNGHGGAGDYCRNDNDCNQEFFCQKNQCIPNTCQG